MLKSIYKISKMDCPSEENIIRMKLEGILNIKHLDFDIPNRELTVYHIGQTNEIEQSIIALNLGGEKVLTESAKEVSFSQNDNQKKLLWIVLSINFLFFLLEMTTGLISESMGLIADSLDMLADAFVYGISLLAVGGTLTRKKSIAKIAGYFQIILAIVGFIEVIRRFVMVENVPEYSTMILVSILALIANGICLYLLHKSKSKEAHMQASMIFTSNDVIINFGVITAGVLVNWLDSSMPDLIIGTIVFLIVIQGAIRILNIAK